MSIRDYQGIRPRVAASAYVDDSAVVIGDVELADDVSVWPMSVLRGDVQSIRVGAASNLQDGCILHVTHDSDYCPGGQGLRVGSGVTVGHRAILHACTVGDYCLIGMGATVMDAAVLGERLMLGAGTLVPPGQRLAGGYLYVDTPARQARRLSEAETAFLEYSAQHYVRLKERHAADRRKRGRHDAAA